MENKDTITSVLGFNFNIHIEGTTPGCRTVFATEESTLDHIKASTIRNYKFFTNFNRALLDKIIDCKRLND